MKKIQKKIADHQKKPDFFIIVVFFCLAILFVLWFFDQFLAK